MSMNKQSIVLENSLLRAVILPELGGKIASLRVKRIGLELLQQPLRPYRLRTHHQKFEDSDASGADECLPTVAACTIDWNGQPHYLPDHGDIWRLSCDATTSLNAVTLKVNLSSLPLCFERDITLVDHSLHFRYRITNVGSAPVPFLGSAHPLFVADAGDRIVLPGDIRHLTLESSIGNRLGIAGASISWPQAIDVDGHQIDLSRVLGPESAVADKLFANFAQQSPWTWCGLYREQHQTGISLTFRTQELCSLGLWLCYGGWPQNTSQRQQCVALEPCTGGTDSLAKCIDAGNATVLGPGCSAMWAVEWFVHGAVQPVTYQEFERATSGVYSPSQKNASFSV